MRSSIVAGHAGAKANNATERPAQIEVSAGQEASRRQRVSCRSAPGTLLSCALPRSFYSIHNQRILNPEPNPYRRGAHLIQFRSPEGARLMLQIFVGIVTTWKRKPRLMLQPLQIATGQKS
jgi:hypothetical protein